MTGTDSTAYSSSVSTGRVTVELQPYYIHTDHLGTPQELTDRDGNLQWIGQYRAWGELAKANDSKGNTANVEMPLRFQGQYFDAETGLHYNRFRYYDPQIGRFTTQDPISLAGGLNLYQYAPNPVLWADPFGLKKSSSSRKPEKVSTKSTGRTKPNNRNEEFAYDHVNKHPENGTVIISSDQINDPCFKGKGWSKVEQKINGVIVHYMAKIDENGNMTHVIDFKIKD